MQENKMKKVPEYSQNDKIKLSKEITTIVYVIF